MDRWRPWQSLTIGQIYLYGWQQDSWINVAFHRPTFFGSRVEAARWRAIWLDDGYRLRQAARDFESLAERAMRTETHLHLDTYYALLLFRLLMYVSHFDPTRQGCVVSMTCFFCNGQLEISLSIWATSVRSVWIVIPDSQQQQKVKENSPLQMWIKAECCTLTNIVGEEWTCYT